MLFNEAKQILQDNGYLLEEVESTLRITQDKCDELAEIIAKRTTLFDSEEDCLDFLTDCVGFDSIDDVEEELKNYLIDVYDWTEEDIETNEKPIMLFLADVTAKFDEG